MINSVPNLACQLAWPLSLLLAWGLGEIARRRWQIPRISVYALVGGLLAWLPFGVLPDNPPQAMLWLAHIAFGLILFEAGRRLNLSWLRCNRWIVAISLLEAGLSFVAVLGAARLAGLNFSAALLCAAACMATSPATIVRTVHEQRSAGQVTERLLHLSVLNSVMALCAYKLVLGGMVLGQGGGVWLALQNSVLLLAASALIGWGAGRAMPVLLRWVKPERSDSTLVFAAAVSFVVLLAHVLGVSPILAALCFGVACGPQRGKLGPAERGFGALGDLLSVWLFVFGAASLAWQDWLAGFGLGLVFIVVRQLAKLLGAGVLAHASGVSWRKGLATGLGLAPLSVFVILLLEQTRAMGVDTGGAFAPLVAAALGVEVLGPVATYVALKWAREIPSAAEVPHAA